MLIRKPNMSEKSKKIYHLFLLIFSVLLLVAFALYIHKNNDSLLKMKTIDPSFIFFLIGIHAINYFLLGTTHFYPLRKHNIFLKFKEWYGLCTVSELFNLLLPANGGTAIRMLYVNEKSGLAKREFLSMGLSVILTGFSLLGLLGIIYCHYFLKKHNIVFEALESLFIALTISSFLLIFASELFSRLFKIKRKYSLKRYLSDKKIVSISILCYLGMFALYPLKVYLSFKAIGIHIQLSDSLEISLILLVTSFFQILPGNIGIKEVATAYIAQQYGIQFESALIASLIDRSILVLFLFPLGAYFYWDLFLGARLPKIQWQKLRRPSQSAQTSP